MQHDISIFGIFLLVGLVLFETGSHSPGLSVTCFVDQVGLELAEINLPLLSKY